MGLFKYMINKTFLIIQCWINQLSLYYTGWIWTKIIFTW